MSFSRVSFVVETTARKGERDEALRRDASPFFRKCRIALEEKGIPYETERLIPVPKTPELLALHPMGKIPVLRDGERRRARTRR